MRSASACAGGQFLVERLEARKLLSTVALAGPLLSEAATSAGGTPSVTASRIQSTSTMLVGTADPSIYGQSVTFTATVTVGGAPVTTGTVTFSEGSTVLAAAVALNSSGQATFSIATLSAVASPHSIIAAYSGTSQYAVSSGTATEIVNPAPLAITGVSANNKIVDGTTSAVLNIGSAALSGVIAGSSVTLNSANAVGNFADPAIGQAKPVTITGFTLSGTSAANYILTQPTGITANIVAQLSIMTMGDSITYGQGVAGGYRTELYQDMISAGDAFQFVGSGNGNPSALLTAAGQTANNGVPYYTTADDLASLNGTATTLTGDYGNSGYWLSGPPGANAPVNPDIILLMIGTNDLLLNNETPQQAAAGLDALVNAITTERPDADLIVSSIPFTGAAYNDLIPGVVSKYAALGRDVSFVDASAAMPATMDVSSDGVHPNAAGYDVFGDEWFGAISQLLPSQATGDSIWSSTAAPAATLQNVNDPGITAAGGVELGLKFQSSTNGLVTGVRFWKGTENTGPHTGELWSSSGQELATATFTNETVSGWQSVSFATPVAIIADTTYIVSYHTTAPYIAYGPGALAAAGVGNGSLHALANGIDGSNGVYQYDTTPGVGSFPSQYNGQSPSYWVDVTYKASPTTPPSAPSDLVASADSATQVSLTWDAPAGVVTGYQIERSTAGGSFSIIADNLHDSQYTDDAVQPDTMYSYMVLAEDGILDSGESSPAPVTTPVVPTLSVWPSSSAPAADLQNVSDPTITTDGGVELGLKFTSDVAGQVTGVRFYKGSLDTGTQTGELWSSSGTLLATATFTNETASGWQQVTFSNPVSISPDTTYIVSYHTTSPFIAYTPYMFASSGADNGPLHILANGVDGNNGVFCYDSTPGISSFPDLYNGQAPNYWVDVVFSPITTPVTGPAAPSAPTSLTATAGSATAVSLSWAASTGTVTAYHVERSTDGINFTEIAADVSGTVYADVTAQPDTTYTYRVCAENTGTLSPYSNLAQVTTPPDGPVSLFSNGSAPDAGLQNVNDPSIITNGGVELGMEFQSELSGYVTGVRFWKGSLNTGIHTGELWSANGTLLATATFTNETASGWQQVTFSTPVAISANTTYIVSYHTGAAYIAYGVNTFATTGIINGVLDAPANGVDANNEVYSYGASSFPALYNGQAPNYWVDVVFSTTA